MTQSTIGVGLIGYGNIGKELYSYYRNAGDHARIARIARRNIRAAAPQAVKKIMARNAEELIADPSVQIVVELTGDTERGTEFMLDAIARGKHVVTASKEALALHWREIMGAAERHGVSVGFEATVGGGMPVVNSMRRHNSTDEIEGFAGILNGTCNFILGQMKEYIVRHMSDPDIQRRSLPLEEALGEAQRLGYAEPDPTLDINGFDTKYKLAILANLAFGVVVDPAAVYCEGIWQQSQRILASDFYFLHHRSYLDGKYELKLVGVADGNGGRPTLRVHPALIERGGGLADLASVNGSYNGLVVTGRRFGTQFLKGLGAGPKPTVISVASDIREIATNILSTNGSAPAAPALPAARKRSALGSLDGVKTRGYIRSVSPDVKGVFAKKLEILARHKVSVQSVVNVKEFVYGRDRSMPDYIEIDEAPDGAVRKALAAFGRLRGVRDAMYFRVLNL